MPPKSLFNKSHRPDGLVVPSCDPCNRNTSTADLVASIISRWRYEPDDFELEDHGRLIERLRKQAPEIIDEWLKIPQIGIIAARRQLRSQGVHVPYPSHLATVGKITDQQLNLFAHKFTAGLYFSIMGEFVPPDGRVCALWKTKEDYQSGNMPKHLFDTLPAYGSLAQGKWNTKKIFEYKYARNDKGIFAHISRFRAGLFVFGFAVRDKNFIPDLKDSDWLSPTSLLSIFTSSQFGQRG